ncbi:MAG: hypothetical protein U9O24_05015 [Campylobacterota bacterium]|nr:hypothetical protein [Campylobacterota bacterium]
MVLLRYLNWTTSLTSVVTTFDQTHSLTSVGSDDILDVSNFKEHHFENLDLNDSTANIQSKLNTLLSDSSIRPHLDSNDTSLIDSSTALDHINTHGKVNTYSPNFRSKGEPKDSEELHYIVNAWAPQDHEFQAHNQYRAMATYNKNIYVFSLNKQSRRPYINKINSIDNTMQTSLLDKNEDEIYSVFDDSHQI